MRALSIRQPWAWLIVRPDITDPAERAAALASGLMKPVENRSWSTQYRGPVLIHASKTLGKKQYAQSIKDIHAEFGIVLPPFEAMPVGGVVGIADIVDCVSESESPWFNADPASGFGFVLRNVRPLPFYACRGALSFFHVPGYRVNLDPASQEL